jgi:multidrug transporter EmrE-like cation transporter
MHPQGKMTTQVFLLVLCAALVTACANLMVRHGLVLAGGLSVQGNGIPGLLLRLAKQWTFVLGLAAFALAALIWFRALSAAEVSICYPILVGLTFIMINVGAVLWLREPTSFLRIVGIAVILAGIVLVART